MPVCIYELVSFLKICLQGGSEQVNQLLHWKSEAESAKNLANWQIYPVFFLAASPEILLFLPP